MSLRSNRTLTSIASKMSEMTTPELVQLWCLLSERLGIVHVLDQHPQHTRAWAVLARHLEMLNEVDGQELH